MSLKSLYQSLTRLGDKVAAMLTWFPPLLARLTVGLVFVWSGWGKLHNLDKVIEAFRGWGFPAPQIQAPFAAINELVFGALLVVGLFSRFAAIPLMIIMIVALNMVDYDPAKAAQEGTFNYLFGLIQYLYIVILMWIAIYGPGLVSIDRTLLRRNEEK